MKYLIIALLFLFQGCDLMDLPEDDAYIKVRIVDNTGVKIYSENLPLVYVQYLRDVTTNGNAPFTFEFEIPAGHELLFESETISFASVDNGSVLLNWDKFTYYQFAITTQ